MLRGFYQPSFSDPSTVDVFYPKPPPPDGPVGVNRCFRVGVRFLNGTLSRHLALFSLPGKFSLGKPVNDGFPPLPCVSLSAPDFPQPRRLRRSTPFIAPAFRRLFFFFCNRPVRFFGECPFAHRKLLVPFFLKKRTISQRHSMIFFPDRRPFDRNGPPAISLGLPPHAPIRVICIR